MMAPIISRRSLLATAISGAVAWLGGCMSFFAARAGWTNSLAGFNELIALCSDLRCSMAVGKACLLTLPAPESTQSSLARTILADVGMAGRSRPPPHALVKAMRERSRIDFCEGRVVTVDGWILSLTEVRVYALAALLPEPHASPT